MKLRMAEIRDADGITAVIKSAVADADPFSSTTIAWIATWYPQACQAGSFWSPTQTVPARARVSVDLDGERADLGSAVSSIRGGRSPALPDVADSRQLPSFYHPRGHIATGTAAFPPDRL